MNEIKYEPVFGDQTLFDGSSADTVCVIKTNDGQKYFFSEDKSNRTGIYIRFTGQFEMAARRIIKTPVWTKDDQMAGKLPPVGSTYIGRDKRILTCVFVDTEEDVWGTSEGLLYCWPKTGVTPIETDAERQQRLREEWCSKALDSAGILSEMKRYDLKRLGEYIGSIHDALLSGELKMPEVQK